MTLKLHKFELRSACAPASSVEPPPWRESSRGTCKAVISSHGVHYSHSGSASVIFSPAASCCARFLFPKAGDKYPTLAEIIIEPIKTIHTLPRFTHAGRGERNENQQCSHYRRVPEHQCTNLSPCVPGQAYRGHSLLLPRTASFFL